MVTDKKHYEIMRHELVPLHTILSDKENKEFLKKYNVKPDELPKMLNNDAIAIAIGAKPGQIVKIIRKSQTAKQAVAYRFVVESGEAEREIEIVETEIEMEV